DVDPVHRVHHVRRGHDLAVPGDEDAGAGLVEPGEPTRALDVSALRPDHDDGGIGLAEDLAHALGLDRLRSADQRDAERHSQEQRPGRPLSPCLVPALGHSHERVLLHALERRSEGFSARALLISPFYSSPAWQVPSLEYAPPDPSQASCALY